jgi:hypothetical protein
MPLNQVPAMQESQGIHSWQQQFPGLFPGQGTMLKKLGEILAGILHHHVQVLVFRELVAAGVQETDQMRMGETDCGVPACKLPRGECWDRWNQFQRGFGRPPCRVLSEEYSAVIRVADAGLQWEESIDYLTRPFRPDFGCWLPFLHTSSHPAAFRVGEDITECGPWDGSYSERLHRCVSFLYANA